MVNKRLAPASGELALKWKRQTLNKYTKIIFDDNCGEKVRT